jgi:hypothetical protein
MKRASRFMVGAIAGLCGFAASVVRAQQVIGYESEGNLESTYDIGCADSESLTSKYSPADLYRGLVQCLEKDDYDRGVILYALAGVYGRFDTLRVADETAHQATRVIQQELFGPVEVAKKTKLGERLQATLGVPDPLQRVCEQVRKIGAPAYFPRYMIQHGMGAVLGDQPVRKEVMGDLPKDGIVAGFDAESAWERALDEYLHCPKN